MSYSLKKLISTCIAGLWFLCVSVVPSSAEVFIEPYSQSVSQFGYAPFAFSSDTAATPGPLSTSSSSGYSNITSATASSTTIAMNYEFGIGPVNNSGFAYADQTVTFHVNTETAYSFTLSAYSTGGEDYNFASLYSPSYGFDFIHDVTDGSGFTTMGFLHPGTVYSYFTWAQPLVDFSGVTSQIQVTGHSSLTTSTVPEPSSAALAGLGFLGLAFAGYRRRKLAAV